MKVKIKTNDGEGLNYETIWACAFDFKTSEDIKFSPNEFKLVETWVVIKVPEWFVLQTQPRSSTFKKYKLLQTNSVWIIDQDYCWNEDTIKFPFFYVWTEELFIPKWTRIWQWMFTKIERVDFEIVEDMWDTNRWGFWTTWE